MKKIHKNNQAFSIVIAIFIIGFLLVLTTGVFNLVLREMKGNRGAEDYLKAYAGAEGAMELGLLSIKNNGYGFDKDLNFTDSGSEVLSFFSNFKKSSDPRISYNMDFATGAYLGKGDESLAPGETSIIPLFWNDGSGMISARKIELTDISVADDMLRNIVGSGEGVSGTGSFYYSDVVKYRDKTIGFTSASIQDFLNNNAGSYLMLYNKNATNSLDYTVKAHGGELFTKPLGNITSSVVVGKYKQNISTSINNSEFLKMLKYSVYNN